MGAAWCSLLVRGRWRSGATGTRIRRCIRMNTVKLENQIHVPMRMITVVRFVEETPMRCHRTAREPAPCHHRDLPSDHTGDLL